MILNKDQKLAVESIDGPVLIVAAPGSGKTRIITERIKNIVSSGYSPKDILAITFTNAAAREMRIRLEKDIDCRGMTICTFHKLAINILRKYGYLLGYKDGFSIYDQADQADIISSVMKDMNVKSPKAETILRGRGLDKFKDIFDEYADRLKAANAFDFDGLITTAVSIVENFDRPLEELAYKYRYISIDEFQDTNFLQYKMAKAISSKWNNLCVCGDGNQSIFGFQGSDVKYILSFEQDNPGTETVTNDTVYRCPSNVVRWSNNLISNNQNRFINTPRTDNNHGEYNHLVFDSGFEESAYIASKCSRLHDNGMPYKEMAVLIRIHRLRSEIESRLKHAGVPVNVLGKTKNLFYDKTVKEFHSYLYLLNNSHDCHSLKSVINTAAESLTWKDIAAGEAHARAADMSVVEGMLSYLKSKGKDHEWLEKIISWKCLTFSEICGNVKALLGKIYEDKNLGSRCNSLCDLESYIRKWSSRNVNVGLHEYLDHISEIGAQEDAPDEEDEDAVNILTIHTAKGLEFDAVFIPGMEEGTFPISKATKSVSALEEERRLFYVAITRTRSALFTSRARKRELWGNTVETDESRFIEELEGP